MEDIGVSIQSAIDGNQAALERLLLDHYAVLVAHLANRVPSSLHAVTGVEDIIQQTYTQVFTSIGSYEQREGASFQSWLVTIADNRLRDAVRAEKRKKRGGDLVRVHGSRFDEGSGVAHLLDAVAGPTHTASQYLARREAIQAIQVAVAGLPSEYREAIQLRYLDGHTLVETADLMQRSSGAVRGLLDRARKKLRQSLERASRYLSSK